MTNTIESAPFQHSGNSVGRIMQILLLALLPGIATSLWFFGIGILINILIASAFALIAEIMMLQLRSKALASHLSDWSVIVTAVLFAIAIPPGAPWWIAALGILFAVIIAKHLFGGLGQNPFNPAMCGYAMLLLAFPLEMTTWHVPIATTASGLSTDALGVPVAALSEDSNSPLSFQGLKQSLFLAFPFLSTNNMDAQNFVDGLALATPLIEFKMAGNSAILAARESGAALFARESKTAWELINIGYLLGGVFLLQRRIISWHIPVSVVSGVLIMSLLFYSAGSAAVVGTPYLHLFGSATMLGAFFIATDPVSAATSSTAKIYYGLIIGVSIYAIRVWGSYLDSIAFAVLFGNFCAPLLDQYCRPRIFGHEKSRRQP